MGPFLGICQGKLQSTLSPKILGFSPNLVEGYSIASILLLRTIHAAISHILAHHDVRHLLLLAQPQSLGPRSHTLRPNEWGILGWKYQDCFLDGRSPGYLIPGPRVRVC